MSYILLIDVAFTNINGAYAPNTLKSYYADTMHFVDWCHLNDVSPFPLTTKILQSYLENQATSLKFSTLRRRMSALRRVNTLLSFDDPKFSEEFHIAWRRIRRGNTLRTNQATGINSELLVRMLNAQPSTPIGLRNRALLSIGYDFLARRSELTALKDSDVEFISDGSLRGHIRKSKTDPYGHGRLVFGSKRSAKLLKNWQKIKPETVQPLFCPIQHGQFINRALSDRSINEIIKKALLKVKGARPEDRNISGHSLRVGAAQDLLIKGHSHVAIMRAGGWTSINSVLGYLKYAEHNVWQ